MTSVHRVREAFAPPSMNISQYQPRLLHAAECSLQTRQTLESALSHHNAKVPDHFRHYFRQYQYQRSKFHLLHLNLIAQIVFLIYFFADYFILSDIGFLSALIRVGLVIIAMPICFWLFNHIQNIHKLEMVLPITIFVASLAWVMLLMLSKSPYVPLYIYGSVLFIIVLNLGVQLSFRTAIYGSCLTSAVLIFAAFQLLSSPEAIVFLLVYLPIFSFSLYISWIQTLNARKNFLRTLIDDLNFYALQNLAHTDELTQLNNRRQFIQVAQTKLGEWSRYEANCLLMFDIDHFKKINDRYGHDVGDEVLKVIAQITRQEMRRKDVLARFGGEEFIALLTETTMSEGLIISDRLLKKIASHPVQLKDRTTIHFTVSIGITMLHPDQSDLQQLIKEADIALYQAKAKGRNCVVQYDVDIAKNPPQQEDPDPFNFAERLNAAINMSKNS